MQFNETAISEESTILNIVDDWISVTLELHRGYYTFYWPCRLAPSEFLRYVKRLEPNFDDIIYVDDAEDISQVVSIHDPKYPRLERRASEHALSLVRINGLTRSWVWQYAEDSRIGNDLAHDYYNVYIRNGLAAYTGCASTSDHAVNFRRASSYFLESVAGGRFDLRNLDLLERYMNQWRKSNE